VPDALSELELTRLMLEKNWEAVIVLDGEEGHALGVVSQDELVKAYEREDARSLMVEDVMREGVPQIPPDIPLAARVVAKGGVALDPRGELYTEENVGERLSIRDLMMELRSEGVVQGGPSQFSLTDRQRFASSLDRLLTHMVRGQRPG